VQNVTTDGAGFVVVNIDMVTSIVYLDALVDSFQRTLDPVNYC